jgi:hypothetical protein
MHAYEIYIVFLFGTKSQIGGQGPTLANLCTNLLNYRENKLNLKLCIDSRDVVLKETFTVQIELK